ncbi:Papain inhibitor [Elsinoe australis]|uniref:Papain inhibitor n=1 Tax=Elsinoe australis TaxID=40998 RepID=A0A2P7ZKA1_9PEZI|nr:Papain inhibitor [Elsinoe australis]
MKTTSIAALTALLSAGAQAVPMAGHHHAAPAHAHMHHRNKRDIVWFTEWEIETVTVLKTVYDDGSAPEPTEPASSAYIPTSAPVTTTTPYSAPAYTDAPSSSSPAETSSLPAYTPTTTFATSTQAPVPSSSSTTSSYVAPPAPTAPSTTEAPAPTTYAPAPTTYSEPAPAPSSSAAPAPSPSAPSTPGGGSTDAGASYTGDATHWDPAMGACGWTNNSDEPVVAISMALFDTKTPNGNPNNNPLCGRYVSIKCSDGSSTKAKVVDRCVGCKQGDLDMTLTLFNKVTGNGDGRVGGMEWQWD